MHDIIKVVINMGYKWTIKRAFYVGRLQYEVESI